MPCWCWCLLALFCTHTVVGVLAFLSCCLPHFPLPRPVLYHVPCHVLQVRQCQALLTRQAAGEALSAQEADKVSKMPGW